MKKWIALALALTLILCVGLAVADETDITVQGSAELYSAPDMAYITANASVSAPTISEAQNALSGIIASVTDKLLALGIDGEDIVTQNYSYYPNYTYDTAIPTLTNYQANHTLRVVCRKLDDLDSIISALTAGGMTEIYSVGYDLSNRSELYREALVHAMSAARSKADIMAQAEGMTIRSLESVTEQGGYNDYGANYKEMATVAQDSGGTGIRAGSVTVSANVTAVFEAAK